MSLDLLILGAGPAGCSAANWAAKLGLSVALVDAAPRACSGLAGYDYAQDWVLGAPGRSPRALGEDYAAHVQQLAGRGQLELLLATRVTAITHDTQGWQVSLDGGRGEMTRRAACLVIATGLRPRRPAAWFRPDLVAANAPLVDALGLTARRNELQPGSRVLLLGGGDNAVENALHLAGLGHRVTVAARHWRGQPGLMARLQARQDIEQWRLPALPRLAPDSAARPLSLLWPGEAGAESAGPLSTPADSPEPLQRRDFDLVAVLFGFEPDPTLHGLALAALDRAHHPGLGQSPHAGALVEVAEAGLFVAGDASGRWHPCLHTALADGVRVAKAAQAWKSAGPRAEVAASSDKVSDPSPLHPPRLLRLQGLEIQASIGWLDHEHAARQAIRLDAELRLESRPLPDDDLAHVLDYRQVRELLIATCAQEGHTRLLETLVERCAQRLMRLPGVLGVRLSITKPDIFEDCHVALATELGRW